MEKQDLINFEKEMAELFNNKKIIDLCIELEINWKQNRIVPCLFLNE